MIYPRVNTLLKMSLAICLTLCCSSTLHAQRVDIITAQNLAERVLRGNNIAPSSITTTLAWDSTDLATTTRGAEENPSFYVFEANDHKGFVIVAADKRICPIIGYSEEYPICSAETLPENMQNWFILIDAEIKNICNSDLPQHPEWGMTKTRSDQTGKVIKTATWSQAEPYNRQCPMDGENRSLTGCTATATGIIMYYHRWPESAWGIAPAFQTSTNNIMVPERDINHKYEWSNMLMGYPADSYTETQADAVATLLADIGHVYQADYGYAGTGALPNIPWLVQNFGYSPGTNYLSRNTLSKQSWDTLMRNEIDHNRPILFSGYDSNMQYGHAFVVDGYDSDNFFHVNWGWEGFYNGFYRLEDLRPDIYEFSYGQWILVGFEPYRNGGDFPNWVNIAGDILTNVNSFAQNEPFSISSMTLINGSSIGFNGVIRVAHTDEQGEIKEWVSEEISLSVQEGYYTTTLTDVACNISEPIEEGDYIRIFYRSKGDEWFMTTPYEYNIGRWEIALRSHIPSIEESTSISFNNDTGIMTIAHDSRVNVHITHLGSTISGVRHEQNCTIIDVAQHHGKVINVHLESGSEERDFTITIKQESIN